jgi:hypothetical protein
LLGICPNYDRSGLGLCGKAVANTQVELAFDAKFKQQGVNDMQARIRIIKRGTAEGMNGVSAKPITKSDCQLEREMVETVKGWVADWDQRKRSLHDAAILLIRSIDRGSESTTKKFAVVS